MQDTLEYASENVHVATKFEKEAIRLFYTKIAGYPQMTSAPVDLTMRGNLATTCRPHPLRTRHDYSNARQNCRVS